MNRTTANHISWIKKENAKLKREIDKLNWTLVTLRLLCWGAIPAWFGAAYFIAKGLSYAG